MLSSQSLAQTAPAQPTTPTQAQQAVAESSKPDAASQPSTPSAATTATTSSDDVPLVKAIDVPTTPAFAPGAKLYIQSMIGFDERVAYALTKKQVPVVLEKDREKADYVLTGGAHVHKRGFFTGFVLSTNGKGSVWIEDARSGEKVWIYNFKRVDAMTTVDQIYQNWADTCANRLKKLMEMQVKEEAQAKATP